MSDSVGNVLEQFNNLQTSGLLYRIEDLKKENRDLNRAISDIALLVSYTRVDQMISFLIKRLNEYFIPQTLVFFVKPPRQAKTRQFFYSNLKQTEDELPEKYFEIFKKYFDDMNMPSNNGFAVPFGNIALELSDSFDEDFMSLKIRFVIPLIGIGGVYAVVLISEKMLDEQFTASELFYIHRIFSVLAVTMQNGLHYEASIIEPKTQLFTYDYFVTQVDSTISKIKRYNRYAAMFIIDIDFFKKFNDTWGHLTGDRVLVSLADKLKQILRSEDCVARFGGEEFSVLLNECNAENVWDVAERIRKGAMEIELYEGDAKLNITVSVGGCLIHPLDHLTPAYIFAKADQALYYSKEHGRNRSTVFNMGLLDAATLCIEQAEKKENEE